MPSAGAILGNATLIANRWWTLAICWHVVFGILVLRLIAGWRPSKRFAGCVLAAPLLSVSTLAWAAGNPFNGAIFAGLVVSLLAMASRFPRHTVDLGSRIQVVVGAGLVALGWTYPHFLITSHWTTYTYAAPLGLLPCPTLSAVIGLTLILGTLNSRAWSLTLASVGLVYGVIGELALGVPLDYGLLAGALVLGAAAGTPTRRSVKADRRERLTVRRAA